MRSQSMQAGSALLILLLIMTVLTLLLQQRLRSGTYSYDVVLMRTEYYKHRWALNALFNYGVAWCTANKSTLSAFAVGKKYELQVPWPVYAESSKPGIIGMEKTAQGVVLTVSLLSDSGSNLKKSGLLEITPEAVIIAKIC